MRDLIRQAIDRELADVDGTAHWSEHIRGGSASCTLWGRHLRAVLLARPAWVALHGVPVLSLPCCRTVRSQPRLVALVKKGAVA